MYLKILNQGFKTSDRLTVWSLQTSDLCLGQANLMLEWWNWALDGMNKFTTLQADNHQFYSGDIYGLRRWWRRKASTTDLMHTSYRLYSWTNLEASTVRFVSLLSKNQPPNKNNNKQKTSADYHMIPSTEDFQWIGTTVNLNNIAFSCLI